MQDLDFPKVALERLRDLFGQDGAAILLTFPIADQDLPIREVKILHPEAERFGEAQARAIQQLGDEPVRPAHPIEHGMGLCARQDDGETAGPLCALDDLDRPEVGVEHLIVEKQQRAQGLILRGGGHLPLAGEMIEKHADMRGIEVPRVDRAVEAHEALDPAAVGALCVETVVQSPAGGPNAVEELGRTRR
jgi:hypothetical protein